ncbi:MAG: hypothetical protein IJ326_00645 [Lachnospiraceae bacterium]|nr:hypothetical protein [Lachnospiraceae bacterium]
MRIVEKLLFGIGGLLALVLLFVCICHFNPELSGMVGESINVRAEENIVEEEPVEEETQAVVVVVPEDNGIVRDYSKEQYVVPEIEDLSIPREMLDRSCYIPVDNTGVWVEDTFVEDNYKRVGYGETGEGLTFDEEMYPYYHMLSDTGKALYRQIYANSKALTKYFVPVEVVNSQQLKNAFMAVVNDHPELFWVATEYGYQYTTSGQVAEIIMIYNELANNLEQRAAELETAAEELVKGSEKYLTKYAKEVYVHDTLMKNIEYDSKAAWNQTAYSALVNGETVCAGYARAFQYVMQKLGIPCYFCTGYAGESHAWNIIKLEDEYYNVDVTWNDTDPNTHLYFNGSDKDYRTTHIRQELSVYLPACNGQEYRMLIKEPVEQKPQEKPPVVYTLSDYGYTYKDVIDNIDDYYKDCFNQMIDKNSNTITFRNVVTDETLWKEICEEYADGSYESWCIERILSEKHKDSCDINVVGEKLQEGCYVIKHTVTFD